MTNNLCAFQWAYIADIAFIIALVVFSLFGAKKGLIKTFFGFVSTIVAVIFAFLFASLLVDWTNGLFGLEEIICDGIGNALSKIEILSIDVSAEGLEAALSEVSLPAFLKDAIISEVAVEGVEAGTTLGMLVGDKIGQFLMLILCGVLILLIIKLLMKIFSGLFDKLVDNWDLTRAINTLLGSLIGLIKGVLIVSLILAGLSLIPMEWLTEFFDNTLILKVLFHKNPINKILAMFLVG